MKNIYSSYIKKDPVQIEDMWANGLITFDTSVLLNLYRYSKSTRGDILKLIQSFQEKIFLTHQAGLEYHRNKFDVIVDQERTHRDFLAKIKVIEDDLNSINRHPFLSEKLNKDFISVLERVKKDINSTEKYYSDLVIVDEIYEEVSLLFKNRVDHGFSEQEIENIKKEGENRYQKKIPPGFEDGDKTSDKKYGDLILWKQIISKAKQEKKHIILITGDAKKDWWWKLKDEKTIGPHFELLEEFKKETKKDFHMYKVDAFLKFGYEFLNQNSPKKSIEEVKEKKVIPFSELTVKAKFSLSEATKLEKSNRLYQDVHYNLSKIKSIRTRISELESKKDLSDSELSEMITLYDLINYLENANEALYKNIERNRISPI